MARAFHCRLGPFDPAEAVALVARSARERLLAINRHRLTREDLEDCYSQATLELLTRARGGEPFCSSVHIANALEQRLLSRIHDRRRALSGRSPIEAAIAGALPLLSCEARAIQIPDARADVERLVMQREDLRRIGRLTPQLSKDQQLLLANQLSQELNSCEFCRAHGWSSEKYRKVSQRARTRLRSLLGEGATPSARREIRHPGVTSVTARRIREQGPTYERLSPHT